MSRPSGAETYKLIGFRVLGTGDLAFKEFRQAQDGHDFPHGFQSFWALGLQGSGFRVYGS